VSVIQPQFSVCVTGCFRQRCWCVGFPRNKGAAATKYRFDLTYSGSQLDAMQNTMGTTKIFVGGLPQNCTEEVLSDYFAEYGNITDSVVMKDRETGNSRGFGFITFEVASSVDSALNVANHWIDKKWVEVKPAIAKADMPPTSPEYSKGKGKGRERGRADSGRTNNNTGFRSGREGTGKGGSSTGQPRPGDWNCPQCSAHVFANKDVCYKCGSRKRVQSASSNGNSAMGIAHESSNTSSSHANGANNNINSNSNNNNNNGAMSVNARVATVGSQRGGPSMPADSSNTNTNTNVSSGNTNVNTNSASNGNTNSSNNPAMSFNSSFNTNGGMTMAMPNGGCMPTQMQAMPYYPAAQCGMGGYQPLYMGGYGGGCGMAVPNGGGCYYDQSSFAQQQQQQQSQHQQVPSHNQQVQQQQQPTQQQQLSMQQTMQHQQHPQQGFAGYVNYPNEFGGCMVYGQTVQ